VATELARVTRLLTEQTVGMSEMAKEVALLSAAVDKPRRVTGRVNAKFLSGGSIDAQVE
jgi:hypothetical protein